MNTTLRVLLISSLVLAFGFGFILCVVIIRCLSRFGRLCLGRFSRLCPGRFCCGRFCGFGLGRVVAFVRLLVALRVEDAGSGEGYVERIEVTDSRWLVAD